MKYLLLIFCVSISYGQIKAPVMKFDTAKVFTPGRTHIVVKDTIYGRSVYADTADTVLHFPSGSGGLKSVRLSDGSVNVPNSDTLNLNVQDFGLSATGTKSNISTSGFTGTVDIIDGANTNLTHEMIFRRGLLTAYNAFLNNTGYGWDYGNSYGTGL